MRKQNYISRILVVVVMIIAAERSFGQQEWGYSQYLFNLYDANIAYSGSHHAPSFALRNRLQWQGFDGAPTTQLFSVHAPFASDRIGAGLRIMHETIGAREQFQAKASGAYRVRFKNGTLSFALAAGVVKQQLRMDKIKAFDDQDALLNNVNWNTTTPTADLAVMYTSNRFYVGVESDRLNRTKFSDQKVSLARLYYNVNFVGGCFFKIRANDLLQVSTLAKYSEGNLYQVEANVSYLFANKAWASVGYRYNYGMTFTGCWNVNDRLRIGYSYDLGIGGMAKYQSGSHELFLGANFKQKANNSIRYF